MAGVQEGKGISPALASLWGGVLGGLWPKGHLFGREQAAAETDSLAL